jgi:hypothetical protein
MRLDYLNHQTFDANGVRQPRLVSYPGVGITLSRRNLQSFLAKLNGHPPLSAARITIDTDAGPLSVTARAQADEPQIALTDLGDGYTSIQVILSRRHLTSLLAHLNGPDSMTIGSIFGPLTVTAEEDIVHYAAREVGAGDMHSATEAALLEGAL